VRERVGGSSTIQNSYLGFAEISIFVVSFLNARPAKNPKRICPAFLPHPPAGRKPNPKSFSKKSVSVLRILLPQNCFAKPSPHCIRTFRPFHTWKALCFAQRRFSARIVRLCSVLEIGSNLVQ